MTAIPPVLTDREFDLVGPLPTGTTLLEASAGTGKTYTIAGLVARYVIEHDVPLPAVLVVTFTRAATAELRDRVRARLVAAADHLAAVLDGASPGHADAVLGHLVSGVDADELRERHGRAVRALADFDAATISTIHGFCQQVLRTLGLAVDADPDAELLGDQRDLVTTVVDDLLVRHATGGGADEVSRRHLLEVAQQVVNNPDARVLPTSGAPDADGEADAAAAIADLAGRIRDELVRRKRTRRVLSYDDLLTQLRDALADDTDGARAAAALRRRYQVALIDEFQDTDPVQWDILRRAFGVDDATLVLIGDPKQAIYSFRGADVYAYLAARDVADDHSTLATNWRSDGPLLTALDTLLDGAAFGDARIAYRSVTPAPMHGDARTNDARPPLRLRCVPRSHGLRGSRGDIQVAAAREHIAADLAAEAVRLLEAGTAIRGDDGHERPVGAGDLAVLVRTNAEAVQVHRALREVQVPAIINGVGSVFETPAATEWLRLLEALEQPANGARARAAALTSFLGWPGERLAGADEDEIGVIHDQLHAWAEVLRDRGVASLLRTIAAGHDLPRRLLGVIGGERHLTDLEHLGQLLHRAAVEDQLGPAALTSWLTLAITDAGEDQVPADEQARRLESDDRAVQILTVHRSKGLQYPIVLAPYLWSPGRTWMSVATFHDDGQRAIDVGGKRDDGVWEAHHERALDEHYGEQLRLLYVALTRAEHQAVVWFAPCRDANKSGLGRVLFARDLDGRLDTSQVRGVPSDERCRERLGAIASRSEGTFAVEETDARPSSAAWSPPDDEVPGMDAARLARDLDAHWHRTSYSRITAAVHDTPLVGSEPGETVKDDEAAGALDGAPHEAGPATLAPTLEEAALRDVALPLGDAPGGTEFGTFVHAVLEHADFAADDLRGHLAEVVAEQHAARRTAVGDPAVLVDGLARAIETPLGPLTAGAALRDFARPLRLDEPEFELPLDPRLTGHVTVQRIGALLADHLDAPDPLAGYAAVLAADGIEGELRGFLTGFIDLVLRVPVAGGPDRFVVADHKTNRLGTWDAPLTAWDYRPAALPDAMIHSHYPLQALIYQVALHRYLRWRLPDYDPASSLGGVLYLFLRGMAGADAPTVGPHSCGVFSWQPPAELIVAVSDLLDGGDA